MFTVVYCIYSTLLAELLAVNYAKLTVGFLQ